MVPQSARERDALMYVTNTRRLEDGVKNCMSRLRTLLGRVRLMREFVPSCKSVQRDQQQSWDQRLLYYYKNVFKSTS